MELSIEPRDGYILAVISGQATLRECVEGYRQVLSETLRIDLARILVDCRTVINVLSTTERYQFATNVLQANAVAGRRLRIALVGMPPVVDGFGILVLQNRGEDAAAFPEIALALEWLAR